jgi:hypothetical protein
VTTPLEFLYHFRDLLRESGVRFAITSGMACVYYGLQQNTKDSDWIIDPADLPKLLALLERHERRVPPWRISYRQIFGAPLLTEYLGAGWTSHLAIQPGAGGPQERVDFFGKAPRVRSWSVNEDGFAVRDVVAMMKRTDRDKDWPIVQGLGHQLLEQHRVAEALVHLQNAASLAALRAVATPEQLQQAAARRPLLKLLGEPAEAGRLEGWLRLERLIWERVNQERHGRFQRVWKEFYKQWRNEEDWDWPTSEPFARQHERVCAAARQYSLPVNPVADVSRAALVESALEKAAAVSFVPVEQLQRICPPTDEMLPP